jgi:bifunctional ADP-heptose synthase (sugar kinase/adenylyltransferase)
VPGLRPPDDERVPVAAPRPPRRGHVPRRGVVDATGAGMMVIVITAAFAALGAWAGGFIGLVPVAGGIVLGFVGVLAGVSAVAWRYRSL